MSGTMHAAVVEHFGKPLVLKEVDVPSPGPGQILVKTEACGVCHTDLHAARGDWPMKPSLPFIPGHEGIGTVTAVGAGVTAVKEGDRVGVPWLYSACGHCEYCLSAWETVCPEAQFGGYTKNGGFAEFILADPNYVAHIPAGLSSKEAAPLICAGITTYKGLKVTEARPGEWVAISGIGGLGHLAVQYAKAMGLHVCAVDIDDGKLEHAKRLGADAVVNAKAGDPAAAVQKVTSGGAHGVLITAPSLGAFKQGVAMTRRRGIVLPIYAAARLSIMVRPLGAPKEFSALLGDSRFSTFLIGPGAGVGDETRARALAMLGTERPTLIDADAITARAPRRGDYKPPSGAWSLRTRRRAPRRLEASAFRSF